VELSIVLPIYNAANIVEDSVERLVGALDPLGLSYEILLKNDGSHDNSSKILEMIDRRYGHVHCSSNGSNEGLGVTLRKLFHEAQGRTIIYCDCDLPFGEQVISLLLHGIKKDDIVVASRYCGMRNCVPLYRKIASRLYYFFCKLLFGISVFDIGSGSVAFQKEALKQLDLKSKGFGIHAELFIKASRGGFSIKEIPAEHFRISTGSFHVWKHGFTTLCETLTLWQKKL